MPVSLACRCCSFRSSCSCRFITSSLGVVEVEEQEEVEVEEVVEEAMHLVAGVEETDWRQSLPSSSHSLGGRIESRISSVSSLGGRVCYGMLCYALLCFVILCYAILRVR